MKADERLLLDTNILVHLLRGGNAADWIESHWQLSQRKTRPFISVISIGEVLALGQKWRWGSRRRQQIFDLLNRLAVFDIHYREVLDSYSELSVAWERAGRRMEQNDLWIAASAEALDAVLLTTDRDFCKLEDTIRVAWISPDLLRGRGS